MTKLEELQNPESCLNKAADDEPIFVLRAQDLLAAELVRYWAMQAENRGAPDEKVQSALAAAQAMEDWPNRDNPD